MRDSDTTDRQDEILLADVFRPLIGHGRQIWRGTSLVVLLAALATAVHYLQQPLTRTSFLEFRTVFRGADDRVYPNGLPFGVTDITDASIVQQVYTRNQLQQFCPLNSFQGGLVVLENSAELQFLNLDYQSRLSDARLTVVDRQRLQDEYASKRAALPNRSQLVFVHPQDCTQLPQVLVTKALNEILETWAKDAEDKRGVMKFRVSVLTPAIFDQPGLDTQNLLVRADLLRTSVERIIANIRQVEAVPGSELLRGSDRKVSFAEIRTELEDLIQARLDPLVAQAGRGLGRQAGRWIDQALQTATIRLKAAEQSVEAYRIALREYSGLTASPPPSAARVGGDRPQSPTDVQALTPQIDRTFIDRIVELSAANTEFRQEITRKAMTASAEAVSHAQTVEQYKDLSDLMKEGPSDFSPADVTALLEEVRKQAKDATQRFNEIYAEFVRVSLRVAPAMYRVDRPTETHTVRAFGLRSFAMLVVGVALITPIVLALLLLLQFHIRKLITSNR